MVTQEGLTLGADDRISHSGRYNRTAASTTTLDQLYDEPTVLDGSSAGDRPVHSRGLGPLRVGPSDFEPLKLIGKGDVGRVYLVSERATDSLFAMKVMNKASVFA